VEDCAFCVVCLDGGAGEDVCDQLLLVLSILASHWVMLSSMLCVAIRRSSRRERNEEEW